MPTESPTRQGIEPSPFNRTAQHDAKRSAILSQAAKLFNYKGSRSTTLRDIAEALGLTKTSLYYYVKTKEELIYQCYMAALDHHHAMLDEIEKTHIGAMERVSAFLLQQFENWLAARDGRGAHIAVLLEIAGLKGAHREQVEARYIKMFKRLREFVRQGVADGSFRPCEPTATTRVLLGSVDWAFSWLHEVPQDQVTAAARDTMDILAHGIIGAQQTYAPSDVTTEREVYAELPGFNREERNRLKQEAFFKTGTWFFNKQGFSGTSLDEIAEHLSVSKGAFYYHIKSKEDLLFNCYSRSLDITENIHTQAAQTLGSGFAKAEFTCRRTFHLQNSDEGPLIRYTSITALPMKRRLEILKRTSKVNAQFGEFLEEGIADGSVRPINIFVAQNLIAGAINAAMNLKLWRNVDNIEAASIDYFDVILNGLLPPDSAQRG